MHILRKTLYVLKQELRVGTNLVFTHEIKTARTTSFQFLTVKLLDDSNKTFQLYSFALLKQWPPNLYGGGSPSTL